MKIYRARRDVAALAIVLPVLIVYGLFSLPKSWSHVDDLKLFEDDVKTLQRHALQLHQRNETMDAKGKQRRHLIYVRIPKTGSSTMTFILWRFGLSRNLSFLLPKSGAEGNEPRLTSARFYLPKPHAHCDLMANHVIYNYSEFKQYFPTDTVYISLIREPMEQLASTIHALNDVIKVPGSGHESMVSRFLRHPELYNPVSLDSSFTRNPAMFYFGLRRREFSNLSRTKKIINEVDKRFGLVLVLERFNESLVLLKRLLNWALRDIMYMETNVNSGRPKTIPSEGNIKRLKSWSKADYLLYNHFYNKLERLIKAQDTSFKEEVRIFEKHLSRTRAFCLNPPERSVLALEKSRFNPALEITAADCRLMTMKGRELLQRIRNRQNKITPKCMNN